MKKTIEIYSCDLCEKEVNEKNLTLLTIPCREIPSFKATTVTVDVCPECLERIGKAIWENVSLIYVTDNKQIFDVDWAKEEPESKRLDLMREYGKGIE